MARKKEDAPREWGIVREDALRIDLYDEGGGLFFYDEANTAAIARDLPKHLGSPDDPAHARLAKAGRLVTVRLAGDGAARLELIVGRPLSARERAVLPVLDAQEALLDLPSGRLHVETPSTVPIPRKDPGADPGFVTQVGPGRYRLAIHRLDTRALRRERDQRRSRGPYKGPLQFAVLTPVGARESVPTPPVVPWIEPREPTSSGRYRVEGGVFKGLVRFGSYWDSFRLNLDPPAAQALGMVQGAGLRVRVPEVAFEADGVYSETIGDLVNITGAEKRGLAPEFVVAFPEDLDGAPMLSLWRIKSKTAIDERFWDTWWAAEVQVGAAPKLSRRLLERLSPRSRKRSGPAPEIRELLQALKAAREARRKRKPRSSR